MASQSNMHTAVKIEYVRCNLCGEDNPKVKYRFNHENILSPSTIDLDLSQMDIYPTIVECRNCGLIYVNPRWTFPVGVLPYNVTAEEAYFIMTRRERIIAFNSLIKIIKQRYYKPAIRAIDIGCGDGLMLEQCQLAGIDCDGFEISESLIHQLRAQFTAKKIFSGNLTTIAEKSYDIVFLINVIEHLPDPRVTLAHIFNILKPGGYIFIHAPNIGGLPANMKGTRWHQIEPLNHLYYYHWKTLKASMNSVGFHSVGSFYLKSDSWVKSAIQRIVNRLHIHMDNGLGIIAQRP
jgi:2-polyprenyl-3-methyl-5-hydroxy-6-metoxy-1,4-benzoquinol methylase